MSFTKLKNMTADAVRNAKTEYYKNEFEEVKSTILIKSGHLSREF